MLNNFFRINMPYGIAVNENGEWIAFNREYMPLGYNTREGRRAVTEYREAPVYTKYRGLTENFLVNLVDDPILIQRNESGKINFVFFYNDATNPSNPGKGKLWDRYFHILKKLSVLKSKK